MPEVLDSCSCVSRIKDSSLPIFCVDTCVWLDFFRGRISPAQVKKSIGEVKRGLNSKYQIVYPEQVEMEYRRNKNLAIDEMRQKLLRMQKVYSEYLQDMVHYMGMLPVKMSDNFEDLIENEFVKPIESLMAQSIVYRVEDYVYIRGAKRSCSRMTPSKNHDDSTADCVILESLYDLSDKLRHADYQKDIVFVTSNKKDFGDITDNSRLSADLVQEFAQRNLSWQFSLDALLASYNHSEG